MQRLANELTKLGVPIPRPVLSNLETGRRNTISVAEVLAIAAALRIPPVLLVLPLGGERDVEVLPGVREDPWTAYRVLVGTLPWGAVVDDPEDQRQRGADYIEGNSVVDAYRDHEDALLNFSAFHMKAEREHGAADVASARDAHLDRLVRVRADMRRNNWALPDLPPVAATAVEVAEAAARRDPYAGFTLHDGESR